MFWSNETTAKQNPAALQEKNNIHVLMWRTQPWPHSDMPVRGKNNVLTWGTQTSEQPNSEEGWESAHLPNTRHGDQSHSKAFLIYPTALQHTVCTSLPTWLSSALHSPKSEKKPATLQSYSTCISL